MNVPLNLMNDLRLDRMCKVQERKEKLLSKLHEMEEGKTEGFNVLLDTLKVRGSLKSDRALSKKLGISAPSLCRMRAGSTPISANVILAIHEFSGIPVAEIKGLL